MLYVGKARSIKKRIAAYMAPERQPSRIARMVAADPLDGVRHHRIGRRGAAARGQSHQAAEAPLQRHAARRQELPLHPDLHRPSRGEAGQASRRAQSRRRLFRAVRQRRRGVPHPERAAAGVPSAHLLGQFLRQSNPAVPAPPDQALLGALHRRNRARRLRETRRGGARFPLRPQPRDQEPPRPRNERSGRGARFRERGAAARPHQRALRDPGRAERQSALDSRSRRVRGHRGGGAVLRRGVLLPHLPELGQPRLFPPRRPGAGAGGGARRVPGAVLSRPPRPAPRALEPRRAERRNLERSPERARRPSHRHRRAAAGRKEGSGRGGVAQRARGPVAQARRIRRPRRS